MTTPFHSKYWAHELTLLATTGSIESLSRSIAGARVELNPHQVDAALFALRSPLTRGVMLADAVGLGKTIEAGIVIAQRWAERRRRILLIVPATLRKQWQQELESKFYLPTTILDSKVASGLVNAGNANPFCLTDRLIVCSYHFASAKAQEINRVPWDLVVIDEAHRLRNVFRKSSKLARNVVDAVAQAPKLLVTATPLQDSLMELYGLASVIDDHLFGDAASFRDQFVRAADERLRNTELRDRLRPICIRTLRKQVVEYIPFTRRVPVTQDFRPSDEEHALYENISVYLQREGLIALPASQRTLITLVLRKLLASSTFAIANTLDRLVGRLEILSSRQGWYHLDWKAAEKNGDTFYRQDHPLAANIIEQCLSRDLPPAVVTLDYAAHRQVVSVLKPLIGSSGWLELFKLAVEFLDTEEFLMFAARRDSGQTLDEEICRKMLLLPARIETPPPGSMPDLSHIRQSEMQGKLKQVEERSGKFFDEEILKLDHWSDDLKQGLKREIKELDRQVSEARKTSALAASLKDKLEAQRTLKSLEGERNRKRRELFDAQDAIDGQRDELIKRIEGQLRQKHTVKPVFCFRWRLV